MSYANCEGGPCHHAVTSISTSHQCKLCVPGSSHNVVIVTSKVVDVDVSVGCAKVVLVELSVLAEQWTAREAPVEVDQRPLLRHRTACCTDSGHILHENCMMSECV